MPAEAGLVVVGIDWSRQTEAEPSELGLRTTDQLVNGIVAAHGCDGIAVQRIFGKDLRN
jgi:hypothetical protein